ncbi:MAG: hypothetical protein ACFFDP_06160, partial [Promethearchaeota archaeon]
MAPNDNGVEKEEMHKSNKSNKAIAAIFFVWIISDMIALSLQIILPIEFLTLICVIWIAELLILFGIITALGGRKIALGAAYLLLFRLFIPIIIIAMFLPLPNPMLTLFQIISLIPIGIILLSVLSWRFASRFDDPHMMEG